ncbi:hypothetical protein FQN57_002844 [Myotisia sp. PD_48]|nr:hypothetical protein FQN57_002844 [Myotisia sp. PD_48]
MSLESALDEERREILDILEGRSPPSPQHLRHHQASSSRHASPAPPIRSMLDVSPDPGAQRHSSVSGMGVGVTQPYNAYNPSNPSSVRSMLDTSSSYSAPRRLTHSATTSPVLPKSALAQKSNAQRRSSDTANISNFGGGGSGAGVGSSGLPEIRKKHGVDINHDYQFEMLPSIPSHALPKRVTQGGKKNTGSGTQKAPGAMASVLSGVDYSSLHGFSRGRSSGRHRSPSLSGHRSRSSSAHVGRSHSPGLNTNSFNPIPTPGTFITDSGKVINLDHAYRKLSNAALSRSGGSLAHLSQKSSSKEREDQADLSDGDVRLQKDYYSDTPDGGFSEDHSSEDDLEETSSGEDEWKSEVNRGRRRIRKKSDSADQGENGSAGKTKQALSLLAAAEEERARVSSSYKVKSLLEPFDNRAVNAAAEKPISTKKTGVHPHTSFDITASQGNTPIGSEDEAEFCDIKEAQNLSVYMSPIDRSVPNRVIRTIIRGDFTRMQTEAEEGRRRSRKYLVATDLSEESVHALEWTIGTILRDGDTLYAIYAIDEENSSSSSKGADTDASTALPISDGFKAIADIAAIIGSQTAVTAGNSGQQSSLSAHNSPHTSTAQLVSSEKLSDAASHTHSSGSGNGSTDSRALSKSETERNHAIDAISETCIRLLRKTRLQVRVAVEVIHCKSPKHLITEAIDGLEPTLVVLGSRGRSALKGVLLGSFSNYLVTKSSVPVMVARKKLRKHAKYKNTHVRLSNNLTTPKKLANAKID